MSEERFLVTGALGCIGAWVVRNLAREGVPTTIFDLGGSAHRLRLVLDDAELERVQIIKGDITDMAAVEAGLAESGATRIIHLAALQVPFCKADPSLGARVNVVGTVNLFEAAKRAGIGHLVYASSVAVYGRSEDYGEGSLGDDAAQSPRTHYGVYKQANEGTARVYWLDEGVSSIGLRPYTIYGPGRDQGLTSGPTRAMVAAAAGRPYHIPFSGRQGLQYADDTARLFIQAARTPRAGAPVFNLRGSVVAMGEIVAAIEAAAPAARGQITFAGPPLPFPEELDDAGLRAALGEVPFTPLVEGVAQSVERFRQAIAAGRMDPAGYLG
ncbi:NAD-dependent epimerase/dehydratase family protein [Oscillochloris sp. ZM17-4]|uniref:NAD-dependent epimerase/dehydratase family protein n=1 Tax=Oscillochloris sp. ZM17-4 TaxID=2866714 RepID=UPI001C731D9B|nr:NAD-dependent epimerase/dehydratase family protein [Oscillochloris sp. ZM17-4]MBX0327917.1 NAD-dependent epimerase/dehydratase family protein [Oscillochloris sp. ZM17-4]